MNWNGFIVGGLFGAAAMAVAENYFLIARQQRLFTYAEQILGMGARLLALVPGKSAPRTDGTDAVPRKWWQRFIPQPAEAPVPVDTAPMQALDVAGGARVRPAVVVAPAPAASVSPQMDAADQALVRFGLRSGGAS